MSANQRRPLPKSSAAIRSNAARSALWFAARRVAFAGQSGTGTAWVPGGRGVFANLSGRLPLANGLLFRGGDHRLKLVDPPSQRCDDGGARTARHEPIKVFPQAGKLVLLFGKVRLYRPHWEGALFVFADVAHPSFPLARATGDAGGQGAPAIASLCVGAASINRKGEHAPEVSGGAVP